jgi:hypothetical protein
MNPPTDPDDPSPHPQAGRANPLSDPGFRAGLRPIPSGPVERPERAPAADIVGRRPSGERIELAISRSAAPVLLCFLHVRCDGCEEFWRGLRDAGTGGVHPDGVHRGAVDPDGVDPGSVPVGVSVVAVTKGVGSVDPAEVDRAASGVTRVPVVMSDPAWADYRVSGYPFFVLVDPSAGVVGETVGFGWADVRSMVEASLP